MSPVAALVALLTAAPGPLLAATPPATDVPAPAGAAPTAAAPGPPAGATGDPDAPARDEEEERLRAIRAQIEELRTRLVAGEEEAGSLLESLDEMDLTMAVLGREATLLEREMAAAARAEERARLAAEAARVRAAEAETALREWLVRLYKTGPAPGVRLALMTSSPAGVAVAARAAERLAVADARRVDRLREERARSEAGARAHEAALARLATLGAELDRRRADLLAARQGKGAFLQGVRARQERGQEALAALVQVETNLQALIRSLAGDAAGPAPSRGLPRFRGLLNWPVHGPVALGFGNVHHPRFDTQVPHPGLEIACPPGATVHALFDGRVVFSSWFRGYGQMIVIDHGDEYLSIYGQLGERLVEAAREVRRDQPIARSGEEGTFGVTGLYLEVRHQGRAEDPRPWLRKGSAQAAGTGGRDDR
jgi:septal ring factor EnvC (AmiA/AmiB activator)